MIKTAIPTKMDTDVEPSKLGDEEEVASMNQQPFLPSETETLKKKESAVVKIQSHVRMRKAIYEYRTLKGAAIAVVAGQQQQDETEEGKDQDKDDMKEVSAAAVKIQSHVRMRRAIYEYRTLKGAAIAVVAGNEVQQNQQNEEKMPSSQAEEESKDLDDMKEESAAVKIQSQFRMRRSIYEYRTLKGAAIAVVAGNELEQQENDGKTLSLSKEEDSKDDDTKKESAVVKIQSQFRMRRAIYEYRTLKGAAIAVVAGNEIDKQEAVEDDITKVSKEEESLDLISDDFEDLPKSAVEDLYVENVIAQKVPEASEEFLDEVEAKTELEPKEVVSNSLSNNEESSDGFANEVLETVFDTMNSEEEVTLEPVKEKIVSPETDAVVGKVGCGACILM